MCVSGSYEPPGQLLAASCAPIVNVAIGPSGRLTAGGVKIGPMHEPGPFAANDETLPMAEYAIRELSGYGLSHLLIMGNTTDFTCTPLEPLMGDGMFRHFRPIFRGPLIANTEMTAERGNRLVAEGHADLVAFGRPFIANPDLVERLRSGAPLAAIDWTTVYASGPEGYIDYPALEPARLRSIA